MYCRWSAGFGPKRHSHLCRTKRGNCPSFVLFHGTVLPPPDNVAPVRKSVLTLEAESWPVLDFGLPLAMPLGSLNATTSSGFPNSQSCSMKLVLAECQR